MEDTFGSEQGIFWQKGEGIGAASWNYPYRYVLAQVHRARLFATEHSRNDAWRTPPQLHRGSFEVGAGNDHGALKLM